MTEPDRRAIRVLVVDDDPDARALVRDLFDREGITDVHEAIDGIHGVVAAGEVVPELVLLDIAMPGPSGLDVLPDLLAASPRSTVVMLSSSDRRRAEGSALARGAVGFVEKRTPAARLVAEILLAASFVDTVVATASAELASSTASPKIARNLVRDLIGDAESDLLQRAQLLTSELVTNAVVHASDTPVVRVALGPLSVRVEVHDRVVDEPERRDPPPESPGGRGLQIVETIATDWGVEQTDAGKVVWFELDRRAG